MKLDPVDAVVDRQRCQWKRGTVPFHNDLRHLAALFYCDSRLEWIGDLGCVGTFNTQKIVKRQLALVVYDLAIGTQISNALDVSVGVDPYAKTPVSDLCTRFFF